MPRELLSQWELTWLCHVPRSLQIFTLIQLWKLDKNNKRSVRTSTQITCLKEPNEVLATAFDVTEPWAPLLVPPLLLAQVTGHP